jgi:hypothetical protein
VFPCKGTRTSKYQWMYVSSRTYRLLILYGDTDRLPVMYTEWNVPENERVIGIDGLMACTRRYRAVGPGPFFDEGGK